MAHREQTTLVQRRHSAGNGRALCRLVAACILSVPVAGCIAWQPIPQSGPRPAAGIPWPVLANPRHDQCRNLRYYDHDCRRRAAPSSDGHTTSKGDGGGSGDSGKQDDKQNAGQSTQTSR